MICTGAMSQRQNHDAGNGRRQRSADAEVQTSSADLPQSSQQPASPLLPLSADMPEAPLSRGLRIYCVTSDTLADLDGLGVWGALVVMDLFRCSSVV